MGIGEKLFGQDSSNPIWYTFAKYFLLASNTVFCTVLAFFTIFGLLFASYCAVKEPFETFSVVILLTAFLALFVFYFGKVPLQGSLLEDYRRLLIHGLVVIFVILGSSFIYFRVKHRLAIWTIIQIYNLSQLLCITLMLWKLYPLTDDILSPSSSLINYHYW